MLRPIEFINNAIKLPAKGLDAVPIATLDPTFLHTHIAQVKADFGSAYPNVAIVAGAVTCLHMASSEAFRNYLDLQTSLTALKGGEFATLYGVPVYTDAYLMYAMLDRKRIYIVAMNDDQVGVVVSLQLKL